MHEVQNFNFLTLTMNPENNKDPIEDGKTNTPEGGANALDEKEIEKLANEKLKALYKDKLDSKDLEIQQLKEEQDKALKELQQKVESEAGRKPQSLMGGDSSSHSSLKTPNEMTDEELDKHIYWLSDTEMNNIMGI